jgi:hypothetical protein
VLTLCHGTATIGFPATSVDGPNAKCRPGREICCWEQTGAKADIAESTRLTQSGPNSDLVPPRWRFVVL